MAVAEIVFGIVFWQAPDPRLLTCAYVNRGIEFVDVARFILAVGVCASKRLAECVVSGHDLTVANLANARSARDRWNWLAGRTRHARWKCHAWSAGIIDRSIAEMACGFKAAAAVGIEKTADSD